MAGTDESAPLDQSDAIDLREQTVLDLDAQIAAVTALTADVSALQAALEDRELLARATGYLMCLAGCAEDDAFALLLERARTEKRSVIAVAADVVGAPAGQPHEVRRDEAPTTADVITEVRLMRSRGDDATAAPDIDAIGDRAWRAGRLAACIIGALVGSIPFWAFMNARWAAGVAVLVVWPMITLGSQQIVEWLARGRRPLRPGHDPVEPSS